MKLKWISIILAISMVHFSCRKEKWQDTSCQFTLSNFSGSYKIIDVKYTEGINEERIDYLDEFMDHKECKKDNLYKFGADGIFYVIDTGVKCLPADDQSRPYRFAGNTLYIEGEKTSTMDGFYCEPGIMYLKYYNYYKTGDELLLVYKKQK